MGKRNNPHRADNPPAHAFAAGWGAAALRRIVPGIVADFTSPQVLADRRAKMRKPCSAPGCAAPHLKGSTLCQEHEFA